MANNGHSPVKPYRTIIDTNDGGQYVNRLMVGTPTTGLIRMEWAAARYGQIIPMNWSYVQIIQFTYTPAYVPLGYMVADAQNIIVKEAIEKEMEWLLFVEHDVILPPDCFIRLNHYIQKAEIPVISGLYFTRSQPSDPLVFRGRGTGIYSDWTLGDLVWVDGVPTGILLVHCSILREMWNESESYQIGNQMVRRVFESPMDLWGDPEHTYSAVGTSDLNWCSKVIKGDYFKKSGWEEYQGREYPFLIDTNIFCQHINPDGERFPKPWELDEYKIKADDIGIAVNDGVGIKDKVGG